MFFISTSAGVHKSPSLAPKVITGLNRMQICSLLSALVNEYTRTIVFYRMLMLHHCSLYMNVC